MSEAEERRFERLQGGFAHAEVIMTELGYTESQITQEYLGRAIFNLWSDDEDREALRTKVHAAASAHVDSLLNAVAEEPIIVLQRGIEKAVNEAKEPSKFPEFDDPAFQAKFNTLHEANEKQFYTWLATADFEALIDTALAAGRAAYALAPEDADDADRHRSWIRIDLGQRHNVKPMILVLQARGIGELQPHDLTYVIAPHEFLNRTGQHWRAEREAVDAFALALSAPGFEMQMFKAPLLAEVA